MTNHLNCGIKARSSFHVNGRVVRDLVVVVFIHVCVHDCDRLMVAEWSLSFVNCRADGGQEN